MVNLEPKRVSDSRTEQIQIIMPEHINGSGRLFGGRLVEWIDIVAAVTARRHSGRNVTTLIIDHLEFKHPAYVNDTLVLIGQVTYTGRTSMEVRVDTYIERLDGEKTHINRAYLVMVALDEDDKPTPVPPLICETEEEYREFMAAKIRRDQRKARTAN
ncbi:MAG: acyl-CoA thioesterase [Clostridiales bacterium]|nr:acyl-CoA thioesterase [Clostridiales bacterium]